MSLRTLVAALEDPRRYPHPVARVEHMETHISHVLLAGDRAYKLKKPVALDFVDFSTLARRKEACEEELRLNRRTAPELYLDVLPIGGTPEEPRLGEEPAFEYAVRMRRFAQEDLALNRVGAEGLSLGEVTAFAGRLERFHAAAATAGPEVSHGDPEAVLRPALDNFAILARGGSVPEEGRRLAELEAWTRREAERLRSLFVARKRAGRVRECHGDLHLGNLVFLAGELTPFDCIEFNPGLRWIDVLSEIAFLAMDLVDHARPALAHAFVDAYLEAAGDHEGLGVLPFYLVYRAMVRAKVAGLRAAAEGATEVRRAQDRAEARGYVELAERLARPRPRALLLMHGLSGSGKSVLAARAVQASGALRLRSDVERKRLAGLAPGERSRSELGGGLYSEEGTEATYARLRRLATAVLAAGFPVVVDATSLARAHRDAFRDVARAAGVPFRILSCRAEPDELRRRVTARAEQGRDPSEAGLAVLAAQLRSAEPLGSDERAETLEIDTQAPEAASVAELETLLAGLGLASR